MSPISCENHFLSTADHKFKEMECAIDAGDQNSKDGLEKIIFEIVL